MSFRVETDVLVPMRDGTRLATDLWLPEGEGPWPTILTRLPYGKHLRTMILGDIQPDLYQLLAAGYAVATQDSRGTYASEGDFRPNLDEAEDGFDTLEWLKAQAWCDGRIGMFGTSYYGFTQWQLSSFGQPELKAISPAFASADWYRALWYSPGGGLGVGNLVEWTGLMSLGKIQRAVQAGDAQPAAIGAVAGWFMNASESVKTLPVSVDPTVAEIMPSLEEVMAHPDRDDYWKQRSLAPIDLVESMVAPALLITGWWDVFSLETFRDFQLLRSRGGSPEAREGTRLVVGPWDHIDQTGVYATHNFGMSAALRVQDVSGQQIRFYDRWVKGETEVDTGAPVRLFIMGIDTWRDEQNWPLPDTKFTPFYLSTGRLDASSSSEEGVDHYSYDPLNPTPTIGGTDLNLTHTGGRGPQDQRPVESRDDVLCYTTEILHEAIEVTGPVRLTLQVSTSAVDTDFMGKLVDVHPDGRALFLCEGMLRLRYRNSLGAPELATPGETYQVEIDLGATANVFLPGHRIRLEISSSNFPRYNRNTNTGGVIAEDVPESVVVAENSVHFGGLQASHLLLPVIDR